jgi:hypothetical protein
MRHRRHLPQLPGRHHRPNDETGYVRPGSRRRGHGDRRTAGLSDGNEARSLTQKWARAIYEDQPAGPETTGIHYRSGYNSGESLALWDCDADVEVVHDDAGHLQDMALADPRILLRLEVELRWRQITVTTVPSSDCNECKKEPLAP